MELAISPEPTTDERAAIEAAVALLLDGGREPRDAWWRAGLPDPTDVDVELQP